MDESLVLFKGLIHFCQYIETKCAHFVLQVCELTTSDGITLDVPVHCGTGMFFPEGNEHERCACHQAHTSGAHETIAQQGACTLTLITFTQVRY